MNKYEIWEEGGEWIARDQQGNEATGETATEALWKLERDNTIKQNLACGRTCGRCLSSEDTGGITVRCNLWDEVDGETDNPSEDWKEYNDPDKDTCEDFHGLPNG